MKQAAHWIGRIWRAVPFREVLLVVALCLWFGENYPFSNFPMYSSLNPRAELVYVTNDAGEPLEMQAVFDFQTWSARKMLVTETRKLEKQHPDLSKAEIREQAAHFVLAFLLQRIPESRRDGLIAQGAQLHWDKLELKNGRIVRETLPPIRMNGEAMP